MRFITPRKTVEDIGEKGFSLIELLIVCIILIIILGTMMSVFVGVQSSYTTRRTNIEQMSDATAAMNLMTLVLRSAGSNQTPNALTPTGTNRLLVKADWNPADNLLNDPLEYVEFFVSNKTLFLLDNSTATPVTSALANNVDSIYFQYLDSGGNTTTNMALVAKVKVTLTVGTTNTRTLIADIALRNRIQPK